MGAMQQALMSAKSLSGLVQLAPATVAGYTFQPPPTTAVASAEYRLNSSGTVTTAALTSPGTDSSYSWRLQGASSDYEVRFTALTGSPTGVFGSWLSLSSNRSVSLLATQSGQGRDFREASVLVEVRLPSGTVLATTTVTLSAEAESEN
jgi:hypothetical protein